MKLLPSRRMFCVHRTTMQQFIVSLHSKAHTHVFLAVTCHLHFWQNDRDLLRATVVTRGWNGYRNKSQHAHTHTHTHTHARARSQLRALAWMKTAARKRKHGRFGKRNVFRLHLNEFREDFCRRHSRYRCDSNNGQCSKYIIILLAWVTTQ